MSVMYGKHARPLPGTPCGSCGKPVPKPLADHCHRHGLVRAPVCPSCNALLGWVDRHSAAIPGLLAVAGRCVGCYPPPPEPAEQVAPRRVFHWVLVGLIFASLATFSGVAEYSEVGWPGPVLLDGFIAALSVTALAEIGIDGGGFATQFWIAVAVGFAAWINWRYALTASIGDPLGAEVVLPVVTAMTYVFIHGLLADARRDHRTSHEGEGTS